MTYKKSDLLNYRQLWWLDKFLAGHKGFIAGGCFKNIFNNERVKDLDIFFESEKDNLDLGMEIEAKNPYMAAVKIASLLWDELSLDDVTVTDVELMEAKDDK